MDNYEEIFKRDFERLSYLYSKANTKSKKIKISYDLILFEGMYNRICSDEIKFPWDDDPVLMNERLKNLNGFINNVLKNQDVLINIINNAFDLFSLENFSVYVNYGKNYHKIDDVSLQKCLLEFYKSIDISLANRFINKLINEEIIINDFIGDYLGLTYPISVLGKSIIFLRIKDNMTIDTARVIVHELGHDFETSVSVKNGNINILNDITKTVFTEVSSSFFEYAFINYLIDNKIYLEDALILKRKFLKQLLYYLIYSLILIKIDDLKISYDFMVKLDDIEVVKYANDLISKMNLDMDFFEIGDKIDFRGTFIYTVGMILGIYLYDSYKQDSKEFLLQLKRVLIDYKNNGFKSFELLNISEDDLISCNVLKRTLKDIK